MIASLATLMSCNNDEVMNLVPVNGEKVTVNANIKSTAATRVALTPDNTNPAQPTIKVDWNASGETFKAYAEGSNEAIVFTQTADTEDSPNLFEGTLPETPAASYTVFYGDKNLAAQDGTLAQESCVLMQATVTDNFASTIAFEHQTAILKPSFKFGDAALDNKTITKITMGGIKKPTADAATGAIIVTPAAALEEIYIFLPAYEPYTNHIFDFTVNVGDAMYDATLTIPEGKSIEAGKLYTADITLKSAPYVTFTANAEQTFTMLTSNYSLDDRFQVSVGSGEWKTVVVNQEIIFGGTNGNLRLRGKSSTGTADGDYKYSNIKFGNDTPVACTGDIRTLMDWENHATVETGNARFFGLFDNCEQLTTAPALPATTLATYCYKYMFSGCKALTAAPALPATKLANSCYDGMFSGCTALQTAPTLPATTLATNCYASMFSGCDALQTAPALPATTLAEQCYLYMFNYCTALTVAPALPATTLAKACYYYMFNHCEKLTTSPELKAKKSGLQDNCYQGMFNKCKALNKITILVTDFEFDAAYYFKGWVNGVAPNGTFFTNGRTHQSLLRVENKDQGNGIPTGWTIVYR